MPLFIGMVIDQLRGQANDPGSSTVCLVQMLLGFGADPPLAEHLVYGPEYRNGILPFLASL
jgi:hypothetical protein